MHLVLCIETTSKLGRKERERQFASHSKLCLFLFLPVNERNLKTMGSGIELDSATGQERLQMTHHCLYSF